MKPRRWSSYFTVHVMYSLYGKLCKIVGHHIRFCKVHHRQFARVSVAFMFVNGYKEISHGLSLRTGL